MKKARLWCSVVTAFAAVLMAAALPVDVVVTAKAASRPAAQRGVASTARKGKELTDRWRTRQFEYSWLVSITDRYVDFLAITEDALVYAVDSMGLTLTTDDRRRLLDAYLHLEPWPDALNALARLKASGISIVALANFSPMMLQVNAEHAGLTRFFDLFLSTDLNHTYKPDPRAYRLAVEHLGLDKQEIVFAALGGWDAAGAKVFGYPTFWVNRFNQPLEQLGTRPDGMSENLDGLLDFVLNRRARPAAPGPTLSIDIHMAPDIEPSLVNDIFHEAEAIWSTAGITLERTSTSGAGDTLPIVVTIDEEPVNFSERQGTLGWIPFSATGPEPTIHLSRTMAEVLFSQRPTVEGKTIAGHRRLIGRALGRALSHELGHYLLRSKLHAAHGLMRANYPSDELFSFDRRAFELTAGQRESVESHLAGLRRNGSPSATGSGP